MADRASMDMPRAVRPESERPPAADRPCACGCGALVVPNRHRGGGHNKRFSSTACRQRFHGRTHAEERVGLRAALDQLRPFVDMAVAALLLAWESDVGCNCGTDEPGTCAHCRMEAALKGAEELGLIIGAEWRHVDTAQADLFRASEAMADAEDNDAISPLRCRCPPAVTPGHLATCPQALTEDAGNA